MTRALSPLLISQSERTLSSLHGSVRVTKDAYIKRLARKPRILLYRGFRLRKFSQESPGDPVEYSISSPNSEQTIEFNRNANTLKLSVRSWNEKQTVSQELLFKFHDGELTQNTVTLQQNGNLARFQVLPATRGHRYTLSPLD